MKGLTVLSVCARASVRAPPSAVHGEQTHFCQRRAANRILSDIISVQRLLAERVREEFRGATGEFSCLIMRAHKINDGTHHRAICAHMGSLAF